MRSHRRIQILFLSELDKALLIIYNAIKSHSRQFTITEKTTMQTAENNFRTIKGRIVSLSRNKDDIVMQVDTANDNARFTIPYNEEDDAMQGFLYNEEIQFDYHISQHKLVGNLHIIPIDNLEIAWDNRNSIA